MHTDRHEAFRPSPLRLAAGPSVAASLASLAGRCAEMLALTLGLGARSMADVCAVRSIIARSTGAPPEVAAAQATHAMVLAAWAVSGLPRVDVGHKHAAALASTAMPPSVVRDLLAHLPWDVTAVSAPSGLFRAPLASVAGGVERGGVSSVLVFREGAAGDHVALFLVPDDPGRHLLTVRVYESEGAVAELVGARRDLLACEDGADVALLMRHVLGALAELMRHRPSLRREGGAPPAAPRTKSGGRPAPTVFRVDRPVRVDCRPQVLAFQRAADAGGASPTRAGSTPAARVTVRAHWKMQPCGPRASMRELIVVEDYERGPEDGPVAVRSHVLVSG